MSARAERDADAVHFDVADYDRWAAAAATSLEGRPADTLRSETHEGIVLEPLYDARRRSAAEAAGLPGAAPFTRGSTADGNRRGW
ncbi:MAG TPA: hypothetical protein DEP66_06410, partial [Acidimicrobiaceae bacterium]|nr:hypothetical protein [Acidimicrobiaceae bacterium]